MIKNDMKKNQKIYVAPQLTVVEFRMERGFADSTLLIQAQQTIDSYITNEVIQMQMGQTENGNVVASGMNGNVDMSDAGSSSAWQYANGGWF
jgi:hypothetical protein